VLRRQLPRCWESGVIGDGADWIDRIYAKCYYDSERIIDWYHASEHLGGLARRAFGEGSDSGPHLLEKRKEECLTTAMLSNRYLRMNVKSVRKSTAA